MKYKKDNYNEYYGRDVEIEMEINLYKGAGREQRYYDEGLDYMEYKPKGERFDVCQARDSMKAYKRAGLDSKTGANNQKASLDYAKKAGIKTKKRK